MALFTTLGAGFPYLPVYYQGLGLDLGAIGALASLTAGVQLLASPIWGAVADRFARSRLALPVAAIVAAVGGVALVNSRDLPHIFGAAFVLAVGVAGIEPILDAQAVETLGADRGSYGRVRAWGTGTFVVVSLFVGAMIDRFGIAVLFLIYVPSLLVTGMIGMGITRGTAHGGVSIARGAINLIAMPRMRVFLVGTFLQAASLSAVTAFYSIRMIAVGGSSAQVGLAWAIGALIETAILWNYGRIAGRWGTSRPLVLGAAVFAFRAAAASLASDPTILILIGLAEGMGAGLLFAGGIIFVAERAPRGLASTAQGVFRATIGLAAIVGTALGGVIANALGITGLFDVCAVIAGVATLAIALAVRGTTAQTDAPAPSA